MEFTPVLEKPPEQKEKPKTHQAINATTHGLSKHPSYQSWYDMIRRCDPKNTRDKTYKRREITVCERWLDIKNFIEDMGVRPSSKHSLDRKDNNKGYYKENCRWATKLEQNNNASSNFVISFADKTMTVAQWGRFLKITPKYFRDFTGRVYAGWSLAEAACTPALAKGNNRTQFRRFFTKWKS